MKKLYSNFSSIYISCWIMLLLLTYVPLFNNFLNTPSDRFYYGGESYAIDLTGNIATVRQGYEGEPLGYYVLTTEFPAKPSLLKFEYILIGKLARILSIDPYQAIFVARAILSFCWFILLHKLISRLFANNLEKIAATIFILFGSSLAYGQVHNFLRGAVFDALVFQRFTLAMPHYLLGGISGIVALYCLAEWLKGRKRLRYGFVAIVSAAIASLTYGPTIVAIISGFPLYLVLRSLQIWKRHESIRNLLPELFKFSVFTLVTAAVLLYVRYIVDFTWGDFNLNEHMEFLNPFQLQSLWQYIEAVGVTYLLGFLALPLVMKSRDPLRLLLFPWLITHVIGEFIISPFLDLNPIRYFLIPYAVPFGILAVDGLSWLSQEVHRLSRIISYRFIFISGFVLVIVSSLSAYHFVLTIRAPVCFSCYPKYSDISYPPKDFMQGIYWLRDNTQNQEIVLSQTYAGLLIPPFAGNLVYLSMWYRMSGNPQFIASHDMTGWFYSGEMPIATAKQFLIEKKISYVFSWDQERQYGNIEDLHYAFLKEVFRNQSVIIYQVINS